MLALALLVGFLVINAFGFGQVKWDKAVVMFCWPQFQRLSRSIGDLLLIYLLTLVLSWTQALSLSLCRSLPLSHCTHKKNLITTNNAKKNGESVLNLWIARVVR